MEESTGDVARRERRATRFALAFVLAGALAVALTVTALVGARPAAGSQPAPAAPTPAAAVAPSAGAAPHAYVYLTILTGRMIGKPGWPMYSPADFTVPANALVTVTIRDMDPGTASVPAANLRVQGTVGNVERVVPAVLGNVAIAQGKSVASVPADDVAHTFTSSALGLNVPVPPTSTVSFTFRTGAPGTYSWQCFAPCGTGPTGWQGAMDESGYMRGTITVA